MDSWKVFFLFTLLIIGCFCELHDTDLNDQTFNSPPKVSDTFSFNLPIQTGFVHFSHFKPKSVPIQMQRRKRSSFSSSSSSSSSGVVEDVCPSVSDWVAKSHAVDPYGNEVTIVQRIPINGTVVNQYFYETFCASDLVYEYDDFFGTSYQRLETPDSNKCKGIDTLRWNSHCKENYIWTYGKVADVSGHTGWSIIGIRGSCSCAIWPKVQTRPSPSIPLSSTSKGQHLHSGTGSGSTSSSRGRRLISPDSRRSLIKSKIQSDPFF